MEGRRLYSLTDFVYNLKRFDENLIYKSLSRHESGLYILSLPTEVSELESITGDLIKTIIQALRRYYDHVVIDCASDLSDITLSCLDESDNIVLVAEPSLSSFRAVNTALQLTQKLGYLRETIKLIVNRSTSQDDHMLDDVVESFDVDVVAKVANDYEGFNNSLKEGKLISLYKPESVVNKQLWNIANMLHNGSVKLEVDKEPVFTRQARGMFKQLLDKMPTKRLLESAGEKEKAAV
ncbi:AAA family ATPase [Thiomicrorhabdus sp.]|uniref:AAA family ATPase n=1 Tax=Thiomicrorhabdus sp. TaxID=2039724 RepID=UPI0029C66C4B|nr:AAA family ATPase [Thiomicrorhabdus sp.]